MLPRAAPLLLAVALLSGALSVSGQIEPPAVLFLEGHEGPLACDPAAKELLCFQVIDGDPASVFISETTVRVALTAVPLAGTPAGAPHNLAVMSIDDDVDVDSPLADSDPSEAIAVSDTAEAGETVFLEFTVPKKGRLYFWCDVGEHEAGGMRFTAHVHSPPNATEGSGNGIQVRGNDSDNDTDDPDGASGNGSTGGSDDPPVDPDDRGGETGSNGPSGGADTDGDAGKPVAEESPAGSAFAMATLAFAAIAWTRRRN